MLKVSEYLKHAEDCEAMAKAATAPEHRQALLKMAGTWRELADARSRQIQRGIPPGDGAGSPGK